MWNNNYAPKLIDKLNNFGKSYQSMTIDTVKGFLNDSKKSKFFYRFL